MSPTLEQTLLGMIEDDAVDFLKKLKKSHRIARRDETIFCIRIPEKGKVLLEIKKNVVVVVTFP